MKQFLNLIFKQPRLKGIQTKLMKNTNFRVNEFDLIFGRPSSRLRSGPSCTCRTLSKRRRRVPAGCHPRSHLTINFIP